MNSAILREETIKKFGYDPDILSAYALRRRKVIVQCPICSDRRVVTGGAVEQTPTGRCRGCGNTSIKPSGTAVSDIEIADAWFSVSVCQPRQRSGRIQAARNGDKTESMQRTLDIFAQLGIGPDKMKDFVGPAFKALVADYLLSLDARRIFLVVNWIFENKLKLQSQNDKTYYVSTSRGLLPKLLDRLGFEHKPWRGGCIRIVRGSFFINGEWIHIG